MTGHERDLTPGHRHDIAHEHGHDGHRHAHREAGTHDDHAGHDHAHGDGRWARIRHALTPHSHDAAEAIETAEQAAGLGVRAAWLSLAGMAATAGLQIVIVWLSGSVGLLADTIHNLGHLVTTIPLLIAFRLGRRAPTAAYPHGFRRAEDLVGILIAAVVAASAAWILWESVAALLTPHTVEYSGWVFAAGLVGAAGNELVAVYRIRIGRRIGSAALIAEGQHARADGLTSLAVVAGVVGVWLGFPQADAIVGLIIGALILAILFSSIRTIVRRLMDGVDPGLVSRIASMAREVSGVADARDVRARWTGHRLEAQLVVIPEAGVSLERALETSEDVRTALGARVGGVDRVIVELRTE